MREVREWERCCSSTFTGVHGWSLFIEKTSRIDFARWVKCSFCGKRPPEDEEVRLFEWMYEDERARRAHLKTPFKNGYVGQAASAHA